MFVYEIMRMSVQFGINSTSDVWKFCQNWTSRRGESNLAKFPNITSTINNPINPRGALLKNLAKEKFLS